MAHFIHYVSRELKVRPRMDSAPSKTSGNFQRPAAHLTRAVTGTVRKVRKGDVIWLVAQLETPWGRLPPAIDARIEVESIDQCENMTRFFAGTRSEWAPLCDATPILRAAKIVMASGQRKLLWADSTLHIGQYLQSMRELQNGELFEKWYEASRSNGVEFISYRQLDGTADAFHHVAERLAAGKSLFWDRWSLPRGVAERRDQAPAHLLDPFLESAIDHATLVWGIDSPGYGNPGTYSAYEMRHAGARLKLVRRAKSSL